MKWRFWSARPVRKEVGGVQRVIAQEFERGTVEVIRSTFRDDADLTAGASSEFCSGDTCLNGELLHRVRDPEVAECRIDLGIDVTNAIQQEYIRLRAGPADVEAAALNAGRGRKNARRSQCQIQVLPRIEGQVGDRTALDNAAQCALVALENRSNGLYFHLLHDISNL